MDRRFAARRTRLAAVPAAADSSQGTPVALVIGLAVGCIMLIAIFVVVAVLRKRRGHQRRTEGLAFLPSLMDRLRIAI